MRQEEQRKILHLEQEFSLTINKQLSELMEENVCEIITINLYEDKTLCTSQSTQNMIDTVYPLFLIVYQLHLKSFITNRQYWC